MPPTEPTHGKTEAGASPPSVDVSGASSTETRRHPDPPRGQQAEGRVFSPNSHGHRLLSAAPPVAERLVADLRQVRWRSGGGTSTPLVQCTSIRRRGPEARLPVVTCQEPRFGARSGPRWLPESPLAGGRAASPASVQSAPVRPCQRRGSEPSWLESCLGRQPESRAQGAVCDIARGLRPDWRMPQGRRGANGLLAIFAAWRAENPLASQSIAHMSGTIMPAKSGPRIGRWPRRA